MKPSKNQYVRHIDGIRQPVQVLEGVLAINVVTINGRIVGRTVSDRWNLDVIGITPQTTLKAAREACKALGLTLRVHTASQTVQAVASKAEKESLTTSIIRRINKVLKVA